MHCLHGQSDECAAAATPGARHVQVGQCPTSAAQAPVTACSICWPDVKSHCGAANWALCWLLMVWTACCHETGGGVGGRGGGGASSLAGRGLNFKLSMAPMSRWLPRGTLWGSTQPITVLYCTVPSHLHLRDFLFGMWCTTPPHRDGGGGVGGMEDRSRPAGQLAILYQGLQKSAS